MVSPSSTKMDAFLRTSSRQALISTRHLIWRGSQFTWRQQRLAEEAPLQEEVVAAKTRLWLGIPLTRKPVARFVPRALIPTAMEKFLSMEGNAKLPKMEKLWAPFSTTAATMV